jgi:NAD(P)-dependent dehydrogenase (short-subunit alcohol dehydrogenase family)
VIATISLSFAFASTIDHFSPCCKKRMSASRVAAIFGAGPGNGAAFAARFLKEGYKVAVLSRNDASMQALATSLGPVDLVRGYSCDVASDEAVKSAFDSIQKDLGAVCTVIYNASGGGGAFKPMEAWTAADIVHSADINAAGLFRVATAAKPQLLQNSQNESVGGGANLVVIGAGAATRGRPNTVGFAAGKAAQRSVAQSLARAWGPEKIHVSYMIIDGVIDNATTKMYMKKPDDFFIQSSDLADAIVSIVNQKQSAWTFEFDVRPFGETW